MEQVIILSRNILIVRDFNFHADDTRNSDTITFNKILESLNLQQHINEPTHKQRLTLDLIIKRNEDRFVNDIKIHDPVISDRMSVHCTHGVTFWTRTRSKYIDLGEFETIWLHKTIRL